MSQIAACRAQHAAFAEAAVQAMLEATSEWPCDHQATWGENNLALGCRLLRLTPEDACAAPPLVDTRLGLAVTADARLDDRERLAGALEISADAPDIRLILLAYARWGEACVQHLQGDYVFAVADLRQRSLMCARDALGVRPLYYALLPDNTFACASELGALRLLLAQDGDPEAHLDIPFVLSYLGDRVTSHPMATLDARIRKVPAGHRLRIGEGPPAVERWWRPERIRIDRSIGLDAAAASVAPLLASAVHDRLRATKPVALHVSGGLDSGVVAALAVDALRARGERPAGAWTWAPAETNENRTREDERIETTACHLGLTVQRCTLTPSDVMRYLRLDPLEAPCEDTALHEDAVLANARACGAGFVLSGWGGDEFISHHGWSAFACLFVEGRWLRLWQALNEAGLRGVRRRLAPVVVPIRDALRGRSYSSKGPDIVSADWEQAPRPFSRRIRLPIDHRLRMLATIRNALLCARHESWTSLAARHGLRHVYPLLDRRLVERLLTFPREVFSDGPRGRLLMRRLAAPWLPPDIIEETDKSDTARIAHLRATIRDALPPLAAVLETASLPPSRTRFVDLGRMRSLVARPEMPASFRMLDALRFIRAAQALDTRGGDQGA